MSQTPTPAAALAARGKIVEEMTRSGAMTMIDPMGLETSHANIRRPVD